MNEYSATAKWLVTMEAPDCELSFYETVHASTEYDAMAAAELKRPSMIAVEVSRISSL